MVTERKKKNWIDRYTGLFSWLNWRKSYIRRRLAETDMKIKTIYECTSCGYPCKYEHVGIEELMEDSFGFVCPIDGEDAKWIKVGMEEVDE